MNHHVPRKSLKTTALLPPSHDIYRAHPPTVVSVPPCVAFSRTSIAPDPEFLEASLSFGTRYTEDAPRRHHRRLLRFATRRVLSPEMLVPVRDDRSGAQLRGRIRVPQRTTMGTGHELLALVHRRSCCVRVPSSRAGSAKVRVLRGVTVFRVYSAFQTNVSFHTFCELFCKRHV